MWFTAANSVGNTSLTAWGLRVAESNVISVYYTYKVKAVGLG